MIAFFLDAYENTPRFIIFLEVITFIFGIASVYFAKKENILVYPTGLVATAITVYLLYRVQYFGDMLINAYYTIMSVFGWYMWTRKTSGRKSIVISRTNGTEKIIGFGMFFVTIIVIFAIYNYFDYEIKTENYFDILTSGLFFTAMWYTATKKIENWILWIIGDIIAVPLYAYKGLGILALEYIVFTILAVLAYIEWRKILSNSRKQSGQMML